MSEESPCPYEADCDATAALCRDLRAEVERLTRERDNEHALLTAMTRSNHDNFEAYKRAKQQLAASQARVTELEQVLRLNLAVSPDDPILVEPVESRCVRAEDERDRYRTALEEVRRNTCCVPCATRIANEALRGAGEGSTIDPPVTPSSAQP